MFAWWSQTCPAVGPVRLATRAFAVTQQARQLLLDERASLFSNKTWFGCRIKHPKCYGYVYLWYDRKKRKLCIGSHHKRSRSASAWDGYLTSTGSCKKEIEKRPHDFRFRVLEYNVQIDCLKRTQTLEQKWLDKIPDNQLEGQGNNRYFNQCRLAGGGFSMNSSVAAKISAAHKRAVADGTHHFVHNHPMKSPTAKEKRQATVAKAVAHGTHHFIRNHPLKDPATKEKMKATIAKAIASGMHNFIHSNPSKNPVIIERRKAAIAKSVAEGTHHFVFNHPMNNFATKAKALENRKITIAKAVANGTHHFKRNHPLRDPATKEKMKATIAKAVANGTHNFIHSNPSKNPIAKEKRKATIAKSVAEGTHHFVCNHPMNNPAVKEVAMAKRKITIAKAVANGTHNFVHSNPMKDPEAKARRKATIEKKRIEQSLRSKQEVNPNSKAI